MNREYCFKIEESEMMEYYRYVFALTPKNKTRVVWIKASIPILLGFTVWYERQVKNWFQKNVKSTSFSNICVKFNEIIEVDKEKIPYSKLNRVLALKHILVFFYNDNQIFIIPNRIIGDDEQMLQLSELLKKKKQSFCD